MGSPSVVFVTDAEGGEVKNNLVPQISGTLPDGTSIFTDYDIVRNISYTQEYNSSSESYYTLQTTTYSFRGDRGTLTLKGGQFELSEFDTGNEPVGIEENLSGAGTSHNYTDFANIANATFTTGVDSYTIPNGRTPYGIITRYNTSNPFSNIESNSAWTSSRLKAFAGVGYANGDLAQGNNGVIFASLTYGTYSNGSPYYTASPINLGTVNLSPATATVTIPGEYSYEVEDEETGVITTITATANFTGEYSSIPEIWYPGQSVSNSTTLTAAKKGSIVFRVYPDSEYTISKSTTPTTSSVGISSISITSSTANGPAPTHSSVTVSCTGSHKLTDNQNQVIISGATGWTHVNGLHNVHSVSSSTSFTFLIPKSTAGTVSAGVSNASLITFDGIDKTGAVLKIASDGTGSPVANVVHGGCAGNNKVLLRGTPNIELGKRYYVYSDDVSSTPITSVIFTFGPVYKSMFHEMGLYLNETTGQVTSNGVFDGVNYTKGIKELDGFFPKFKHARDQALNRETSNGTITQSNPVGEGAGDTVTISGSSFVLPPSAFYKTLTYANGFTSNVAFRSGDHSFTVNHETQITEPQSFVLKYEDRVFPVPNTSAYWAFEHTSNLALNDRDLDDSKPALLGTHEMFNTPVHFTIRAMKKTSDLQALALGTTSSTVSYSGFGTFENGSGNFADGELYVRIYTTTDSDRDNFIKIYSDQNNAVKTSDDFNRNDNAFEIDQEPVTNQEFLANNYSNGNFTVLRTT